MIRKISDFSAAYSHQRESTLRVMRALSDSSLARAVAPGHRQLGWIAWHLVVSIPEMMNRTGLSLKSVDEHAAPPDSAASIADAYETASAELHAAVVSQWQDETLLVADDMYGEKWPRGMSLSALMAHETHHRGQMTVLMRQAGLVVPGVLGPSKEEWAQYGAEAPPY